MKQYRDTKYYVTEDGRVINSKSGLVLKSEVSNRGYHRVTLCNNGVANKIALHRIVAWCYLGEPNGLNVNHKDLNKNNNSVINLEYCTHKQNCIHAAKEGKYMQKLNKESVREIRKLYSMGYTQLQIGDKYGVSNMSISAIITGKTFKWVK